MKIDMDAQLCSSTGFALYDLEVSKLFMIKDYIKWFMKYMSYIR